MWENKWDTYGQLRFLAATLKIKFQWEGWRVEHSGCTAAEWRQVCGILWMQWTQDVTLAVR